jgi:hypothetical protein
MAIVEGEARASDIWRSLATERASSTLADSELVARCKMCCAPSVLLPTGIKASWPHHEWKHILSSGLNYLQELGSNIERWL